METAYAPLLSLLGAYLRQEPPQITVSHWDSLLSLAQIHSVSGIVGYMGKKYPICQEPQRLPELRSLCLNTISMYARRQALARELVQQLDQAGIDHVLMKGYVLWDYYPVPELRTFTDVDIVIHPEDRERSHQLMLDLGFQVKTDWEPVYSYHRGIEYYEIHTQIMEIDVSEKADYRGYFANAWSYALPVSEHSHRFTPEFHFLYMLTHIAKHIHGSGAGIRLYLDVAAFFLRHGADLDWTWVQAQLQELQLWDFACVVFGAVNRWFGVGSPMVCDPVPEATLQAFTEFTLEAGVFGHYNRDLALASLKHADQMDSQTRAKHLLRRSFPKAETLQSRYTYLQQHPWLLPVAWVHRLVKTRQGTGKHMAEVRQVLQADTDAVTRLKQLTKDIGL